MITIQNVGEALHLIETKIFLDDAINPFPKEMSELISEVRFKMKVYDERLCKETEINLAASLTRLISELP